MGGGFCDLLDGPMARKHGGTPLGENFDDAGDASSFAINPTAMIIKRCIDDVNINPLLLFATMRNKIILAAALIYFLAIIFRLIRFLKDKKSDDIPDEKFNGLPSPAGAAIILGATNIFYNSMVLLIPIILITSYLSVSHYQFIHGRLIIAKFKKPGKIAIAAFTCGIIVAYNLRHQNSKMLPYILFIGVICYISTSTFMILKKQGGKNLTTQ